jgi:hypothetical protein
MPLDPCRILPGRRTLSRDQALAAVDQAGTAGLSSRELALRVALPVERVRRALRELQVAGVVVLRWCCACGCGARRHGPGEARWFRAEVGA